MAVNQKNKKYFLEKGVDKQKKVCYNWLTAKTKETKLVVNQNGKEVIEMKIQVTTSKALTVQQLEQLVPTLRGIERYDTEVELQAEVLLETETADLVSNPQSQPFSVDIYVDDTNLCDCVISQ